MKKFDVMVKTGTYVDNQGQEKGRWMNCGVVFENEQGHCSLKLDAIPTIRNDRGELWFSLFVPKQKSADGQRWEGSGRVPEVPQEAPRQPVVQQQPEQGGFRQPAEQDVPF